MNQKGVSQKNLTVVDDELAHLIENDLKRQNSHIHLIASENFASQAVMEASGSVLTNKYSEGIPGRRYYEGCEVIDQIEQLAIDLSLIHISEPTRPLYISYAVFCLKKKKK